MIVYATAQEPGDEGPEAAPAQAPLVQVQHVLGPAPARGREAGQRDDEEQHDDDGEGDGVDVAHLATSPSPASAGPPADGAGLSFCCSVMTIHSTTPSTGM